MTLREKLDELRAWYGTVSGKLAAIFSTAATIFVFVSQDPTVALFTATYLPFPLNVLALAVLWAVCYVLPHYAIKKDAKNGSLPDA